MQDFLNEKSQDEYGKLRYTHERLIKAKNALVKLLKDNTMFTYLNDELREEFEIPATTNLIEGGVNFINKINSQSIGTSHQQILSYKPK